MVSARFGSFHVLVCTGYWVFFAFFLRGSPDILDKNSDQILNFRNFNPPYPHNQWSYGGMFEKSALLKWEGF